MFKHFLIMIVIIVLIVICVKFIFIRFQKLYIHNDIIKYTLNQSDSNILKMYSDKKDISSMNNKSIFYSDHSWNTKNNNYIHDTENDRYYIIDSGYYYYIPDPKRYLLIVNKNIPVNIFDTQKYKNKVVFV